MKRAGPRGRSRREDEDLRPRTEELLRRAEEAEETIRAIRSGEVDSLVVEGAGGPRVYALEGTNHAYRVLVEAMSEGAVSLNEEGTILYCNRRFAEFLGAPLNRVMGRSMRDFVSAAHRPAFDALLRKAKGGEGRGELSLRAPGGRDLPVYLSIRGADDGGRRALCVVATDLREQKRHEEIVASEGLARSIIEQAADAIVVCDARGRIIRANASAGRLCGGGMLLRPFGEAFDLELLGPPRKSAGPRRRPRANVARVAIRGERLSAAAARVRREDGSVVDVLVSAAPLHGSAERVIGCVILLVDVSETKRAEEALRESEARFRSVLENSLDAAYRRDLRTGRFDYLSPTIQAIHGFSVEEMSALSADETVSRTHPDDRPALERALRASARTGELRAEYRFRGKDGQYRWVADSAIVVKDGEGRPRYRSGVLRDITDRKRYEEALRTANVELAEADRNKNEFVAMLSHELRNPLAPIVNSIHVLERAAPGGEPARRAVAVMRRQTAQLARLVDDLLDVTRISRNKIQLRRRRLDLNEVVQRAVEDQRSLFQRAGIRLEFEPAPAPVVADADANRVAQIVGNLLQNAAKFTGRGGTARVLLRSEVAERRAVLTVSDTGVGMAPEMVPRLFQPFSQAPSAAGRRDGGLGLGLALVKGLATLHGGDVSAHSAGPGRGAEFRVRLPLAADEHAPTRRRVGSAEGMRPRRVLVIDDNVDGAESLRDVLALGRHEVVVANSGPEGIAKARRFRPEVVLCDIRLPGMDGYEVARILRGEETLRGVRLVALSGHARPEDVRRAREAGFDQHIAKPPRLAVVEDLLASLDAAGT